MTIDFQALERVALQVPEVLLPAPEVDLSKWAVVACDQYTSEPSYWQQAEALVGDAPSTLNLIFPEVHLEAPGGADRIRRINATMQSYLDRAILRPQPPGFVLVDRASGGPHHRRGLVVAMDLDHYDFQPGATSLIRATEGTILERLPPRIEIRRQAPIELPHIMVLIDDPQATVIEPLFEKRDALPRLYDFDLMMGGGHLTGYRVSEPALINQVAAGLTRLATREAMAARYQTTDRGTLLYAMGDGNHSLATAKSIWQSLKADGASNSGATSPARHALVELVNVHDEGLEFEAIHRVLFKLNGPQFWDAMKRHFESRGSRVERIATKNAAVGMADKGGTTSEQVIGFIAGGEEGILRIENPPHTLAVGSLQTFLDEFLANNPGGIDYIHGESVVRDLGGQPDNIGFLLPPIPKHDLFKTVMRDGPMPRKAFSMGEAHEKRFYMEGRRIAL